MATVVTHREFSVSVSRSGDSCEANSEPNPFSGLTFGASLRQPGSVSIDNVGIRM